MPKFTYEEHKKKMRELLSPSAPNLIERLKEAAKRRRLPKELKW